MTKDSPFRERYLTPLNSHMNMRITRPMDRALRTLAIQHKTDVSAVVRGLLKEALEARGINTQV